MSTTTAPSTRPRVPDPTSDALLQDLENKLLKVVQELYEMEIRAGDVVSGKEGFMEEAVEQLVQDYAELSSLSQQITTTVPLGLLSRIDSLTNPHEYTKNLLTTALEANQYGNAKLHAYGRQYELLAKEIGESFPEMRGMLGMPVSMGEEETRAEKEQKNVVKNEQETDVNAIPGSTSGHERKEEAVEISLNSPEQEQKPYHQQQQQHQQVHLSQVAAAAAAGTDTSASTYDATRVDVTTTTTTTTSGDVDMQ